MDKFNAEFEKIFAAANKKKELTEQINAKNKELQQLYREAGKVENFLEYKDIDKKRSAILEEVNRLADQINSEPDSSEEVKDLWKQYVKAYNAEFEKQYSSYLKAKKTLAAQLASLIEMQGEAINRHARCAQILDKGKSWFYNYDIAQYELDLDAPACLPESMLDEIKALANTGVFPIEKKLGYTMIIRKQKTSAADMNIRYEDLPPVLQAGFYSVLNT